MDISRKHNGEHQEKTCNHPRYGLNNIKKFKKGVGIHANGKITYDLSDKDYDNFEALIGVDTAVGENDYSKRNFQSCR